jgi:hypothetical protein
MSVHKAKRLPEQEHHEHKEAKGKGQGMNTVDGQNDRRDPEMEANSNRFRS